MSAAMPARGAHHRPPIWRRAARRALRTLAVWGAILGAGSITWAGMILGASLVIIAAGLLILLGVAR